MSNPGLILRVTGTKKRVSFEDDVLKSRPIQKPCYHDVLERYHEKGLPTDIVEKIHDDNSVVHIDYTEKKRNKPYSYFDEVNKFGLGETTELEFSPFPTYSLWDDVVNLPIHEKKPVKATVQVRQVTTTPTDVHPLNSYLPYFDELLYDGRLFIGKLKIKIKK